MINRPLFGSLTRISDLATNPFEVQSIQKEHWATGDYVVGFVSQAPNRKVIELPCGRLTEPMIGDHVIGAFGVRAATLDATGHWNEIRDDGRMHALTAAGLMGKATSVSPFSQAPLELDYVGHCVRSGSKLTMSQFAESDLGDAKYDIPTILLIGTSMSSGKTTTARIVIRELVRTGLRVAGVKLTGAGRRRDTLAMRDAGADPIMDFVDAGLPSTVCSVDRYRSAVRPLLVEIQSAKPDIVVAEAGASPIEPYNGDTLMEMIQDDVCFTILCASDPYAVIGVQQGFGYKPDLVAGLATSTSAGVEVIQKMSGVTALNLLEPASVGRLNQMLSNKRVTNSPTESKQPNGAGDQLVDASGQ